MQHPEQRLALNYWKLCRNGEVTGAQRKLIEEQAGFREKDLGKEAHRWPAPAEEVREATTERAERPGPRRVEREEASYARDRGQDLESRQEKQRPTQQSQWKDEPWRPVGEWARSIREGEEEPEEAMVVKCLQLMSEGHFKPNQQIMLTQPHNEHQVCLLENMVQYLGVTSKISTRASTAAASGVAVVAASGDGEELAGRVAARVAQRPRLAAAAARRGRERA